MSPRVLFVVDSVVPGGAELSIASLIPRLAPLGVECAVAYFHARPGLQPQLKAAGAELYEIGGTSRRGWYDGTRRAIAAWRPDLVHTTLFEADIVGRPAAHASRTPVVSSLVSDTYGASHRAAAHHGWRLWAAQAADMSTARLVRRFHAVTHSVAEAMARRLRLPRDRVDVVYRGRDADALGRRTDARRLAARERLGIDPGTPVLLAAGRQEPQKGFDVLLDAFATVVESVPEATLLLAGREGAASPSLLPRVQRFGDRVRLLGRRDDVADLMVAADVFVLPSRWEGAAGVLIEAMALEAPVVASDLPTVRETAASAAVLVPPGDPGALGRALVAQLADPGAAEARAARGRQRFLESFTLERAAAGMHAFYVRACGT